MPKEPELPEMTGKGVEIPSIKAVDKAADEYQTAKDKRCQQSPRELAAKGKLQELLHKHRDALPKNEEGYAFYRYEGRDYVLEEKMAVRKVAGAQEQD